MSNTKYFPVNMCIFSHVCLCVVKEMAITNPWVFTAHSGGLLFISLQYVLCPEWNFGLPTKKCELCGHSLEVSSIMP